MSIENLREYKYTIGDVAESLSIMKEAAIWLIDIGKPMWTLEEIDTKYINNPAEEFIVMWDNKNNSIATLVLSFNDEFFWSDIPPNISGFIHKLSIRRNYASQNLAKYIIQNAINICKQRNIKFIRLDCDPHRKSLCEFYENVGFILKEIKSIKTERLGEIDLALYEMDID